MNFIIGFIILVSQGNELDTFFSFIALACNPRHMLIGLFEPGLPLLRFLEFVSERVLAKKLAPLAQHLRAHSVPVSFLFNKWYLTLFLYNIPIEVCLRLWDSLVTQGVFELCALSAAILALFADEILATDGEYELMALLQGLSESPRIADSLKEILQNSARYHPTRAEVAACAKDFLKDPINANNLYAQIYVEYADEHAFTQFADSMMQAKKLPTSREFSLATQPSKDKLLTPSPSQDMNNFVFEMIEI